MNTAYPAPDPLGLTALVALFSALVALAFAGAARRAAHNDASHAASAAITPQELALRQDMRELWDDHITWTRLAVISLDDGLPDAQATVARLLRNQSDIGNAIKPFYGRVAGTKLTALLRQHILIAQTYRGREEWRPGGPGVTAGPLAGERRRDRDVPLERESSFVEARARCAR